MTRPTSSPIARAAAPASVRPPVRREAADGNDFAALLSGAPDAGRPVGSRPAPAGRPGPDRTGERSPRESADDRRRSEANRSERAPSAPGRAVARAAHERNQVLRGTDHIRDDKAARAAGQARPNEQDPPRVDSASNPVPGPPSTGAESAPPLTPAELAAGNPATAQPVLPVDAAVAVPATAPVVVDVASASVTPLVPASPDSPATVGAGAAGQAATASVAGQPVAAVAPEVGDGSGAVSLTAGTAGAAANPAASATGTPTAAANPAIAGAATPAPTGSGAEAQSAPASSDPLALSTPAAAPGAPDAAPVAQPQTAASAVAGSVAGSPQGQAPATAAAAEAPVAPATADVATEAETPAPGAGTVASGSTGAGGGASSGRSDQSAADDAAPAVPAPPAAKAPEPVAGLQSMGASAASATPHRSVPLEHLPRAVVSLMHVASERGISQARISVRPEELGGVEIHLQTTPAGLVAQVIADSPEAARLLTQAADELRRSLARQDVILLSLDVSTSSERQPDFAAAGGSTGREADEQRSGSSNRANASGDADGALPADLVTTTVIELPDGLQVDVLA